VVGQLRPSSDSLVERLSRSRFVNPVVLVYDPGDRSEIIEGNSGAVVVMAIEKSVVSLLDHNKPFCPGYQQIISVFRSDGYVHS
jgi:hypothetical protein